MQTDRLDPQKTTPELYKALLAVEKHLQSNVDPTLYHLLKLRASMVNGCAFCVDMHSSDAIREGEAVNRLFALAAWRETPFFDERERAVLALTDAMTTLGDEGVPDEVWDEAAAHFDERELLELVGAAAMINLWNRVAITLRRTPLSAAKAA